MKFERPGEQSYGFVPKVEHPEKNRYGQSIETVPEGHELRGESLNINGDKSVSDNPNRYKQHGFYLDVDNCIGCHACEAACAAKNETAPHIAFRSVGYLEGGAYPAYHRMNISMACNHCDDPVCLKGCPTRAYTKFAEYGAVLQDPDICFGCGYCTWVCPYNAPQLDTEAGHVSKCNMCVDRLEEGLKPACASACLGGALDFGVIETMPENRSQLQTQIPGFPDPEITHPNIRFEQTKSLPRDMKRTDSWPLHYERDEQGEGGSHKAKVDPKHGLEKEWNLADLSTRENPLVIFTLVTQAVVGLFALIFLAPLFGFTLLSAATDPIAFPLTLFGMIGVQTLGLVLSTLHLGKPHRFYRAFNNLKYSPVSREVAGVAVFYNLLGLYGLLAGLPNLWTWLPSELVASVATAAGYGAIVSGIVALYFMHKIYRIKARPFWNHWQVLTSFYGSMISLGAISALLIASFVYWLDGRDFTAIAPILLALAVLGLAIEGFGLYRHSKDLTATGGEAAAAHYLQTSKFGKTYLLRNIAFTLIAAASLFILWLAPSAGVGVLVALALAVLLFASAVIGRALFYALVVPTTMPGAFFWKNPAFAEQAQESGLAEMEQVGVLSSNH